MKGVFTASFVRALVVTVVSSLIIVGGIYAYGTLWSGKALITVSAPTGVGHLEVTGVEAIMNGTWDESTDTWTASIARAQEAQLRIYVTNTGGDAATFHVYMDGVEIDTYRTYLCSGVYLTYYPYTQIWVATGETSSITLCIVAEADAEPGTLSYVELELRLRTE